MPMSQSPLASDSAVIVKGSGPSHHINVLRHLVVPAREVEGVLTELKSKDWVGQGFLVLPSSIEGHKLVPVDGSAPVDLPAPLGSFEVEIREGEPDKRALADWLSHLETLIGKQEVLEKGEAWPSSHEFISDMMIVRIDEEISNYTLEIAEAKLRSHPHVRLILNDEGVQGELRVRGLAPIGAREGGEIYLGEVPAKLCNTRVSVKESGISITCDPTKAFYSTKLQTERIETVTLAKRLRERLGRPIRVCDPFCGVGPAIGALLKEPELIGSFVASDLNPHAVEMLMENLRRWDNRDYPPSSVSLQRLFDGRFAGVADATELRESPDLLGNWDLILVNLPHRTIELLPELIPLLDLNTPSLIRGRVVVAEDEIDESNQEIVRVLPTLLEGEEPPSLQVKRDYSSSLRLCSFEAWIGSDNGAPTGI